MDDFSQDFIFLVEKNFTEDSQLVEVPSLDLT